MSSRCHTGSLIPEVSLPDRCVSFIQGTLPQASEGPIDTLENYLQAN